MSRALRSPFPYFGGKSRVASLIWERFGNPANYIEPFFGSGATLLSRPMGGQTETVNDLDGLLANFWRALRNDPEQLAYHADYPVSECDLHARHLWLVGQRESITSKLQGDPDWFDVKAAGWWVWGISCWIGSGWCSGKGNWFSIDGEMVQLPHLGSAGQGVNRKRPHLGDAGRGVNRKRPPGKGAWQRTPLDDYFIELAERLRGVRICCGDWSRVCGPSVTFKHGMTAVLLDPPYADTANRSKDLYAKDCEQVAHAVRVWALENGSNRLLRIALCGYEGEHEMPTDWECVSWKPRGGYDGQNVDRDNENRKKERIWFSPHCVKPLSLFDFESAE